MSFGLLRAINMGDNKYVQSPIDDLESFFHVFLWAILYHKDMKDLSVAEETWRTNSTTGTRDEDPSSCSARHMPQTPRERQEPAVSEVSLPPEPLAIGTCGSV